MNSGPNVRSGIDEGVYRHGITALIGDIKEAEVIDVRPIISLGLNVNLPLQAKTVEVVNEVAAEESLQGLICVSKAYALNHRLGLIDIHIDLRNVPKRCGENVG